MFTSSKSSSMAYERPRRFAKIKLLNNLQNDPTDYKYLSTVVEKLLDRYFSDESDATYFSFKSS